MYLDGIYVASSVIKVRVLRLKCHRLKGLMRSPADLRMNLCSNFANIQYHNGDNQFFYLPITSLACGHGADTILFIVAYMGQ